MTITPRVICNNSILEVAIVKRGVGITRLPLSTCENEIRRGELEVILEDYDPQILDIYLVYPHRQFLTAKVRAFVDFVVAAFPPSSFRRRPESSLFLRAR